MATTEVTSGNNSVSTSQLMGVFANVVPGSDPSYQDCKIIYANHPLGKVMVDKPIELAQSQKRTITIEGSPEGDLVEEFDRVWDELQCDAHIASLISAARIYGIASLIYGSPDFPTDQPFPLDKFEDAEIYFNVLDSLNTAGSLVLNQDPNAPDFQKPNHIFCGGNSYHASRSCTAMNENSIYILFTNSAFGFVGRSVYQRCLYPLGSFVKSMLTDDYVVTKSGLIVYRGKTAGSVIDNVMSWFSAKRRESIKAAKTNNVLQIGENENVESINLNNLKDPTEFARNNILKNVATSANMPASLINQETLAEGFGEGTEDAKNIARYIDKFRIEIRPSYKYMDNIVMRKAWGPRFYESMQRKYPALYASVPYETAFYDWKRAFKAEWPNLLVEPDSEKVKVEEVKLRGAIGIYEALVPQLDPENKAEIAEWVSNVANECKLISSAPLNLDTEALASYQPMEMMAGMNEKEPQSNRDMPRW